MPDRIPWYRSDMNGTNFALAFDLGTTTLAASLIVPATGQRLGLNGSLNPQRRFGADVVSRLEAAVHSENVLKEMAALVRAELLRLGRQLCESNDVPWDAVRQVAIAGNPAMQHILLQLPVTTLAAPPYRPLSTAGKHLTAAGLGWPGSAAVYIFPMPGGFVGGDTVAFLYGQMTDMTPETSGPTLLLDMGTNGEMALHDGTTIWATSAAAGPAFEGGNLTCGMSALPGAISSCTLDQDRIRLAVIGETNPIGICGSAAIEIVSELLRSGIVDATGRLLTAEEIPSNLATRIVSVDGEPAFSLYRDAKRSLVLTQGDIRQIQLAKGAIRAGMDVLSQRSRIHYKDLCHVILTGSFGAVLRPEWLKSIGIFDESMIQICRFVSEGALCGVERALITGDGFSGAERLGSRFQVVPLSGTPLFESAFLEQINFPR